jgi:hypothetical protein
LLRADGDLFQTDCAVAEQHDAHHSGSYAINTHSFLFFFPFVFLCSDGDPFQTDRAVAEQHDADYSGTLCNEVM